ncbi:MAG: zinc metalloprotease [Bacteroidetes bacterium]|nr:zinc metalloprotease [Bacteroidota bacterium]
MNNGLKQMMLAALLSGSVALQAQEKSWCGSMDVVQEQLRDNPEMQQRYHDFIEGLKQEPTHPSSRAANEVIFIPVVFHIIHNGDAVGTGENITESQVYSQIDILNQAYNNMDAAAGTVPDVFKPLVANVNVQFCLAKFDPSGNPTTGIIRHEMSRESWDSSSTIDKVLKPATIWDRNRYLNIWTVRMGGSLTDQGILAYSSFPGVTQSDRDGVVCRFNLIGASSPTGLTGHNKGKSMVHEVGHWLGLLHIWGDDDGKCANDPNGGSDYISDTPDQADLNFGCPVFPHVTCNNGPNGDMFMNYMDYVNDECMAMFTPKQAERMIGVLNSQRSIIKTAASKCYYSLDAAVADIPFPKDTVCSLGFQPAIILKNEGLTTLTSGKIYYQWDGGAVQSQNWNGSLAMQQEAKVLLAETNLLQGDHSLYVTFETPNGQPADNLSTNDSKDVVFYVYDGGVGIPLPISKALKLISLHRVGV